MKLLLFYVLALSALVLSCSFNLHSSRKTTTQTSRSTLEMKGRGSKVPVNQRGEYMKQQRMMQAQQAMQANKKDGVPTFKVFTRPKAGGLWIPCGDLMGDERATALCNAWMSGFMQDMYKNQLDQGIAKSLFSQGDQFVQNLLDNYKPFKRFTKDDLEFGYKIEYEGLEEKMGEQKMTVITKGMEKNWADNIREGLSGMFSGQ